MNIFHLLHMHSNSMYGAQIHDFYDRQIQVDKTWLVLKLTHHDKVQATSEMTRQDERPPFTNICKHLVNYGPDKDIQTSQGHEADKDIHTARGHVWQKYRLTEHKLTIKGM